MPASYPSALKTFTTKVDVVDTVEADHVNALQLEVVAIETALGVDVNLDASSVNVGTVRTRLNTLDAAVDAIESFPVDEGTLAGRPAADGTKGIYRTNDGNGTFIDIASAWYQIVLGETYTANTILAATTSATPVPLTLATNTVILRAGGNITAHAMGSSTILARLAAGNIVAATPLEIRTLIEAARYQASSAVGAASEAGRLHLDTDDGALNLDTGSAIKRVTTVDGGQLDAGKILTIKSTAGDFTTKGVSTASQQRLEIFDAAARNGIRVYGSADSSPDVMSLHAANATKMSFSSTGTNLEEQIVSRGALHSIFDRIYVISNSGVSGAQTFDWSQAATIYVFLTGNTTPSFTWPSMTAPANPGYSNYSYTVRMLLYWSTAPTITWPGEIHWVGGTAPTLVNSKVHEFLFHRWHNSGSARTHGTFIGTRE